jgi:hypothetical protein
MIFGKKTKFEEKIKLAKKLETLPAQKLIQAMEILKDSNIDVKSNDEDEFELEINGMDIETLWELDQLLANWEKSCNKKSRSITHGSNIGTSTKKLELKLEKNTKDSKDYNSSSDLDSKSSDSS